MLNYIKKWSYNKKLNEKKVQVQRDADTLVNMGKKISILYELDKLDDYNIVHRFKEKLSKEGRVVKTLSYIDQKIDVATFSQKAFSKKEITWDGIPDSPYVEDFINWESDILICPIQEMRPGYEYIIRISPARFKIGLSCPQAEELFDLIIDIPTITKLDQILEEILNQLKIISH